MTEGSISKLVGSKKVSLILDTVILYLSVELMEYSVIETQGLINVIINER